MNEAFNEIIAQFRRKSSFSHSIYSMVKAHLLIKGNLKKWAIIGYLGPVLIMEDDEFRNSYEPLNDEAKATLAG